MASKNILVAYYSRTGNNKKIALEIAQKLKADTDEIVSLKNYSGSVGWLKAGADSARRKEVKIKNSKNPADYGLVVIGCPIWAGVMAAPLYTYMKKNKFKKIAFFSVSGAGEPQKVHDQLREMGLKALILSLKEKEAMGGAYREKINEFCKKLK